MTKLHGKITIKRLAGAVNIGAGQTNPNLQAKSITPTNSQQVVTPDANYGGLSRVTVEAAPLQAKTVAPATGAQSVKPDEGYLGLSTVTVEAAPLQEITAEIAAEIQHLVPDPGFYGFSGVTVKALPDAETAAFCESVSLPEIPPGVLEDLSFTVITEVDNGGTTIYLLAAAESAFFYGLGSVIGKDYDKFLGSLGAGTAYYTTAEGTSWTKSADLAAGSMVAEMTESTRVVYSNHDIYQVEADDDGSLSVDILYYAKSGLYGVGLSDAYRIQRETMEDLGDQVNRLTGTAESMTPGRMTQKLEGLSIQLQELTVVATEEVQIITPPSGVYGFSKVIVEAVEDSGGTGGGGTGEGGDDSGDGTYVSADSVGFGDEITEETKITYNGYEIPEPKTNYPSTIVFRNISDGTTYMCGNNSSWKYYADTNRLKNTGGGIMYKLSNGAWVAQGGASSLIDLSMYSVIYTDSDIEDSSSGEVWMVATVPKETTVIVRTPVDHDDTYTIDGNTVNAIAVITQKITGNNETLTPAEAAEALEEYYASLNP